MVEEKEKQQDGKIGLLRIDKWLMINTRSLHHRVKAQSLCGNVP